MAIDNTINGRTPEEIKRGLEKCPNADCSLCLTSLHCDLEADALAYIQQLERERDEARNDLDTINYANTELSSAYDAMKRERDAAVEDMTELMHLGKFCRHCKYITDDGECTHDFDDTNGLPWNCWQWRGVPQEDKL